MNDILCAVVTSIVAYILWYLKTHHIYKDDQTQIILIFLRGQLYMHYDITMQAREIDSQVLNEVELIYSLYHRYGGNGTGTRMMEDMRKLKIVVNERSQIKC